MLIKGLQKLTLLDYPTKTACTIFTGGCNFRCPFCHNASLVVDVNEGEKYEAEDVLAFLKKRVGLLDGVCVTGGEPLLQVEFLTELFTLAKERNIHTCIDTSGITFNRENKAYMDKLDRLLSLTDMVMLDIKHIDSKEHKDLTGHDNTAVLEFAKYLDSLNISIWVRHIIIPGITDNKDELEKLGEFIGKLKNLHALDVLPYHTMGVHKYEELGIEYPLKDVKALSVNDAEKAKLHIIEGIKKVRGN